MGLAVTVYTAMISIRNVLLSIILGAIYMFKPTQWSNILPPMPRSILSRPTDLFYFVYFVVHIGIVLVIDLQGLVPASYIPNAFRQFVVDYVNDTKDPLTGGLMGYLPNTRELVWFRTFMVLEVLYQFPMCILGARAMWKDIKSFHLSLLVYGAVVSVGVLPCLTTIYFTPSTSPSMIPFPDAVVLTTEQRRFLLSSYFVFFAIPLYMACDMAGRVRRLFAPVKAKEL